MRAQECREMRETRAAAQEEKQRETLFFCAFPISCLQSHLWSFACLACLAQWTKKKERLLIVYNHCESHNSFL